MFKKTFVFFIISSFAAALCAQTQNRGPYSEILGGDAEKAKQKPEYSYLYNTSLIKAINDNDVDRVNMLLYAGVDPNEKNDEGTAPLVAAAASDPKITEMLLKRNAKVNEPSKDSVTPLMAAAQTGNMEVVSLLLEYGANPNAKDKDGKTALDYAAENKNYDVVLKLIDTKIIKIDNKETALSVSIISAAGAKDMDAIHKLMDRGASIDGKNQFGYTPLIAAVDTGDYKFVREILALNPNLELKDNTGRTALMHSVQNNDDSITKLLLNAGANPQTQDLLATTPLVLSAKNSNNALVKEMLKRGADVNAQDRLGRSALSWAVENGDYPVFNTIIAAKGVNPDLPYNGENTSPLMGAAKKGDYKMTYDLLSKGADPNLQDTEQNTALFYAVKANHTRVATLLVEFGANPYIKSEDTPKLSSIARDNNNTKLAAVIETEEKRVEKEGRLQQAYKEQMLLRKQAEEQKFWDSIEDIDDYIAFLENQLEKAKIVKSEREAQNGKKKTDK